MNSRERFLKTMAYERPDRAPCFEEGIRDDVLEAWGGQGMPPGVPFTELFPTDGRLEIMPDIEPRPEPEQWPTKRSELEDLRQRLDPDDPERLPAGWAEGARQARARGDLLMLRVHRGFFETLGILGWRRFAEAIYLLADDPEFVHELMEIQADFATRMVERVLQEVKIDAAVFSEPIAGNNRSLISPRMYEKFVLPSYEPILETLKQNGVETIIVRTYANARVLLPSMMAWGFNCLWACETNPEAMDYRALRQEFGRDLRLIAGIDTDALRYDKEMIRRELERIVPPLLGEGGYIPLADGRIRADMPYENYVYYRRLLEKYLSVDS
jgi:hypothetical protein